MAASKNQEKCSRHQEKHWKTMEIFETYGNVQKTMEIFEKSRRRNKSKTYLHLFVNPQRIQEHKKQETHSKTQDTKNKAKKRNKKHKTKK